MRDEGAWGPWRLDADRTVLVGEGVHRPGTENEWPWEYEIDLEWRTTSAGLLDWIAQVRQKTSADAPVVAGLVVALDDVLNLQHHLCGAGQSKRLSREEILRLVVEAANRNA